MFKKARERQLKEEADQARIRFLENVRDKQGKEILEGNRAKEFVAKVQRRLEEGFVIICSGEMNRVPFIVYMCEETGKYHKAVDFYLEEVYAKESYARLYSRYDGQKDTMEIIDVTASGHKGQGSILMECLLYYAQKHKVHKIWGELAPCDLNDHRERLYGFYKKFGFEIIEEEGTEVEHIEKIL